MIDWISFQNELTKYFTTINTNRSIEESANRLASMYMKYALQGSNIYGNKVVSINYNVLKNGFKVAFYLNKNSFVKLGVTPWIGVASAMYFSWSGATLSPIPVVPPSVTPSPIPSSCVVTLPGFIFPLALQLWFAFSNFIKSPQISSKLLISAIRLHFTSIQGLYFGLMPSPSGLIPSIPTPWIGIF